MKVTKESLDFIEKQREEIDELYTKMFELADSDSQSADFQIQMIQHELKFREEGISMLERQRDALGKKEGNIGNKYWIDEYAYIGLFFDYRYDLLSWLVGMAAVALWMCSIEAEDVRMEIYPLLSATRKGREAIRRNKVWVCLIGALLLFAVCESPNLLRFAHIDGFQTLPQRMDDFTQLAVSSSLTLGDCMIIVFLLKFAVFAFLGGVIMVLAWCTKNAAVTAGAGIGLTGIATSLCVYFQTDIAIWVIHSI